MYIPSRYFLGSLFFIFVACWMFAAVWLTSSLSIPVTSISSPLTTTFVESPIILAILGALSPMKFSMYTSLPLTLTVIGK